MFSKRTFLIKSTNFYQEPLWPSMWGREKGGRERKGRERDGGGEQVRKGGRVRGGGPSTPPAQKVPFAWRKKYCRTLKYRRSKCLQWQSAPDGCIGCAGQQWAAQDTYTRLAWRPSVLQSYQKHACHTTGFPCSPYLMVVEW